MKRRYVFVVIALAAILVTALSRKEPQQQFWPDLGAGSQLKFSHAFHVKEAGIACQDCHTAAKTSKLVSDNLISTHDNCVTCHEDQINNSCGYCHVHPDSIEPLAPRSYNLIFSHEQHVGMSGVECATCHTDIDNVTLAGAQNMPTMATCTTCHNDSKATSACKACHTSFTNLIPADHLVADFKKEHKKLTRLGALDVSCATCHTQTFCADCHGAAALVQIGKGGLMTEPSPRSSSPTDGPQRMDLQMVHSMNYRYTHGIDAKQKSADCYSCHSARTFCAECHNAGDNVSARAFKPAWHLGAGFTTLGVGSGGGRHAEMARRDIESCASCHDTQGSDPTCITCHTDADGIRGTDPKTHPAGFMRDVDGPWHSNPGAVCYNCHTDYNAHPGGVKGRNFCGYCHG
jgi:hypothetical protein